MSNTTPKVTSINLGPQDFQTNVNSPFILSSSEMIAVQTYVEAALKLPTTDDAMKLQLGLSTTDEVTQYIDLLTIYQQVFVHCNTFKTTTYPMTVALASDIVHYNTKVPIYYGAMNTVLNDWVGNGGTMPDDMVQKKLVALANSLQHTVQGYAKNAQQAFDFLDNFVKQTEQDNVNFQALNTKYRTKLEGEDGLIKQDIQQIATLRQALKDLNDQYAHDVTVAATTPTYAWVIIPFPPFYVGLIAATTVASVYGKRASDDLANIHSLIEQLAQEQADLQKAFSLVSQLRLADDSLSQIIKQAQAALPILQTMEGIWGGIASDLNNLSTVVEQDIKQAELLIADAGIQEAITDWAKVAQIADIYRANAYITVTTEEEIKQDPEKHDPLQSPS
jgi:hypothetical protein